MSFEQRCPDCGHIIEGDELKKRQYYSYMNHTDPNYIRCTKCQREHDKEHAMYNTTSDPAPDELGYEGDDVGSARAKRGY